jgi:aspartate aminotransferase
VSEVVLTNGGKQALFNTALALFNPGDEVITHAPYWPTIPEQIKIAQATPVIVQTKPDDGFTVHPRRSSRRLRRRRRRSSSTRRAIRRVADGRDAMTPIVEAAAARGIWVIVDLCYEHLIYDEVNHNLPKLLFDKHRDRSVICGSLSKTYAMTGWRAGWTIAPKDLTQAFNVIMGHTTSNIASIVQKAGVVALNGPQDGVKVMLDEYRRRRDAIHGWLTATRQSSA